MVYRYNEKAGKAEKATQKAIAGIKDGIYRSKNQAVKELRVLKAIERGEVEERSTRKELAIDCGRKESITMWINTSMAAGNLI
jgi:hypothetical protein